MREILWGGEFYITLQSFCVSCAVLVERERKSEELYKNNKRIINNVEERNFYVNSVHVMHGYYGTANAGYESDK